MPLFKRKPFALVEAPQNLKPHEPVFQVRFTKEIFKDYQEYLNQINLYRQRVWTCKVTGKSNLTYEEALVSERRATEKVQQFPNELMAPVLHMIQFSTLRLKDLVNTISTRLQERSFEGEELRGRKGQSVFPCKILKVLEEASDGGSIQYEVGWLDKNKKVTGTSIEKADNLIWKKLPFSREVLKSFIRESTSRSAPWVVHDKLAQKYGISSKLPEELGKKVARDGHDNNREGWKNISDAENGKVSRKKRIKRESENPEETETINKKAKTGDSTKPRLYEEEKPKTEFIRYPIEDLLVQPGVDDPVFTECPSPTRDFSVPMDCVGDLLMVWDFCSSFGKLLHLWPFSLEDFERAIVHKESNLNLVVESHAAVLRLLIKDKGEYFTIIQKKRKKSKVTHTNWTEYLCDFLEMEDVPELSSHTSTIRRGHYGLLDTHAKLSIFRELIEHAFNTDAIREQLDEYIEQLQTLAATKWEESRKIRENQQQLKEAEPGNKEGENRNDLENDGGGNLDGSKHNSNLGHIGDVSDEDSKAILSNGNHGLENGEDMHAGTASRKSFKDQKLNAKVATEKMKYYPKIEEDKRVQRKKKDNSKEDQEKKHKEERKEHFEREIEKRFIRTNPLGKDRNYNRYWFFRREGRVFVESSDSKKWGYYTAKEELDKFLGSLNPKGERERALQRQIEKYYVRICSALQKRSKEIAQQIALEEAALRRSTRVRTQPKDSWAASFLKYTNKWRED